MQYGLFLKSDGISLPYSIYVELLKEEVDTGIEWHLPGGKPAPSDMQERLTALYRSGDKTEFYHFVRDLGVIRVIDHGEFGDVIYNDSKPRLWEFDVVDEPSASRIARALLQEPMDLDSEALIQFVKKSASVRNQA